MSFAPPMEQADLERHEAKYIIPPGLVPEIREFLKAFCVPDPNAKGDLPEYTLTTLQLDSPDLALYRSTCDEAINRFKLRVRIYDSAPNGPVFMEVKRKIKGLVVKSRCRMPAQFWGPQLFARRKRQLPPFKTHKERANFIEFTRLTEQLGARPVMLIRYVRESYMGANDVYARVTFDRRLCYSPTRSWELPPADRRWRSMDSATAFGRRYSGVILELKTYRDAPLWMVELTERFNLVRTGFCKYAQAVRMEMLYDGAGEANLSKRCTYSLVGI